MKEVIDPIFAQALASFADFESYPEFLETAGLPTKCDFCGHTLNAVSHVTTPIRHILSNQPLSNFCGTNCMERYLVHCLSWKQADAKQAVKRMYE